MPFLVAHTVVSLLRRRAHTKQQGTRAAEERNELAPLHRTEPKPKDHGSIAVRAVHRSKSGPLLSTSGSFASKTIGAGYVRSYWLLRCWGPAEGERANW